MNNNYSESPISSDLEHVDIIACRNGVSAGVSATDIFPDHGMDMTDMGLHDSFFERQSISHTNSTDINFVNTKSPTTTIRSVSSSDGRSMKYVSDMGNASAEHTHYNRRWHRHTRDVSLAAPGSNHPYWHLAKSNPPSSATPPSQFLKYHVSDGTHTHVDFHSLEDSSSRTIQNRHFPQLSSSLSPHTHEPLEKRTPSPPEEHSTTFHCHSTRSYDHKTMLHNMESSTFIDQHETTVSSTPFESIDDINHLFSDEIKQSRPSVISNSNKGIYAQTSTSACLPFSEPDTIKTVNLTSINSHASSSEHQAFVNPKQSFGHNSEYNSQTPFIKLEYGAIDYSINRSTNQTNTEQSTHNTKSLYSNNSSRNQTQQNIQSSFLPQDISSVDITTCPRLINAHTTTDGLIDLSQRNGGSRITISASEPSNNAFKPFKDIFVRLNGNGTQVQDQEIEAYINHVAPPPTNSIVLGNMFVSLSSQRRSSLPGTEELLLDSPRSNPSRFSDGSTTPTFLPSPASHSVDSHRKQTYFQTALRDVIHGAGNDKNKIKEDVSLDNSYESMKNFFSNAKPLTIEQMYKQATGDFSGLSQVIAFSKWSVTVEK